MALPIMAKATAVWLVDNTTLTFKQIADFCGLHELEVNGIADGEVGQGIKGFDPISNKQLTADEIQKAEKSPIYKMELMYNAAADGEEKRRRPRYTPLSKRQDRPASILWLVKFHPELTDGQISKLVGSTKGTVSLIRKRSYWNFSSLKAKDPVILGLCSQNIFEKSLEKAKRRVEREKKAKIKEEKLKNVEGLSKENS